MSAFLNTNIKLKGTTQELIQMIKVIKENKYLSSQTVNKKYIDKMIDDEIETLIKENNNEISIDAAGPHGRYMILPDTKIFESITNVAPNAYFYGISKGFDGNSDVELVGELKDKKLRQIYTYTTDQYGYDEYIDYVIKLLPIEEFCKLFKIDEEDLDEDDFEDFFTSEYLDIISLSEFKEYFSYSNINESEFKKAQDKYNELKIDDFSTWRQIKAEENAEEWIYDPFDKTPTPLTEAQKFAREISNKVEKIEFDGKIFVHTYCYDSLDSFIANRGGIVKSSVVVNTDYIIIGDHIKDKTTKIEKAIELNKNKGKNIKALTLSEFEELVKL